MVNRRKLKLQLLDVAAIVCTRTVCVVDRQEDHKEAACRLKLETKKKMLANG
jgi:hypothetical protein